MAKEAPATQTPEPTPTSEPVAAVAKEGAARWVTPILALIAALVIGLFGGVLIGHATASPTAARAGFGAGGFGPGGFGAGGTGTGANGGTRSGFAGGGFTAGTIQSIDGDTITIKAADGSTVTVTTSGKTTVTKTSKSSVSSLTTGEQVTVIGAKDSSGNVAATTISEGAGGFGGGFRGGAGGAAGNGAGGNG